MAARHVWAIVCVELLLYAIVIGVLHATIGIQLVVLAGLVPIAMLVLRVAIIVSSFIFSAFTQRTMPLTIGAWLHMIAAEVFAFLRFQYLIALHPRNDEPRVLDRNDTALLVLLHGIYCNGAVWRPVVEDLRRRTGFAIRTPDLQPLTASLESQADHFAKWLQGVLAPHPTRRLIVVAHSLGGLVVRRFLIENPHINLHLICLGSPHEGTALAKLMRSPIARDLRPGSAALGELERIAGSGQVLNIYATHDNLIVPSRSGQLAAARNRSVVGCGHMALIYSRETLELIAAEIEGILRSSNPACTT